MWLLLNSFIWTRGGLTAVVALVLLSGAFYSGVAWQRNQCATKFYAQREVFINQLQAEHVRANEAAQKYEIEKNAREEAARTITRETHHVIQKPVYRSCRLDADGMRLIQSAIHQANRASQSDQSLPSIAQSSER